MRYKIQALVFRRKGIYLIDGIAPGGPFLARRHLHQRRTPHTSSKRQRLFETQNTKQHRRHRHLLIPVHLHLSETIFVLNSSNAKLMFSIRYVKIEWEDGAHKCRFIPSLTSYFLFSSSNDREMYTKWRIINMMERERAEWRMLIRNH